MNTNRRAQPLYRDPNDKMLAGVCSGLGAYFDIDTTLVRVAFVVVSMIGGGGVLAYVLLWAILDPAPSTEPGWPSAPGVPPVRDARPTEAHIDDRVEPPLNPLASDDPVVSEAVPPGDEPITDER